MVVDSSENTWVTCKGAEGVVKIETLELTLKLRSDDIDSFIRSSINVNFLDSTKSSLLYIIETADVQVQVSFK